jgi:hypothetical protein
LEFTNQISGEHIYRERLRKAIYLAPVGHPNS